MAKDSDSEISRRPTVDERPWRTAAVRRRRRLSQSGVNRSREFEELYEEFRRNKSVDL